MLQHTAINAHTSIGQEIRQTTYTNTRIRCKCNRATPIAYNAFSIRDAFEGRVTSLLDGDSPAFPGISMAQKIRFVYSVSGTSPRPINVLRAVNSLTHSHILSLMATTLTTSKCRSSVLERASPFSPPKVK